LLVTSRRGGAALHGSSLPVRGRPALKRFGEPT
jgi:hypothetical protein